ncbi:MAG TPA: hypothetical protein VE173_08490, partial [Longimicrobiales bacterium]|nr:hypothetical protein [Longimicrobiales bacterium]
MADGCGIVEHWRGDTATGYVVGLSLQVVQIRFTFSDITTHSLRWNDGNSQDGGRTWSTSWIME